MRRQKNHDVRDETSETKKSDKEGDTEKEEVAGRAFCPINYFFLDKTGDFCYRFSLYNEISPWLQEGTCICIH